MALPTLVLASASPRRRRLLERLGLPVEVRPSNVDETATGPVTRRVLEVARRKAEALVSSVEGFILAADTLGSLDGEALAKPADANDAVRMLWRLADRAHDVHSGVVVLKVMEGHVLERAEEVVTTRVSFRPLGLRDIREYVDSGEYEGKAGGYAIQGNGRRLVQQIEGSYTNVVGLPLPVTVRLLRAAGYPLPAIDAEALDAHPDDLHVMEG